MVVPYIDEKQGEERNEMSEGEKQLTETVEREKTIAKGGKESASKRVHDEYDIVAASVGECTTTLARPQVVLPDDSIDANVTLTKC